MQNDDLKKRNLAEFAKQHYGFVETEKSTRNSPALQKKNGDTIVIKYHEDGVNTFFDPKSEHRGDIYNFVQWQENCDFRTAAQKIKSLLGISEQQGKPVERKAGKKMAFDKAAAAKLTPVTEHAYLADRGIPGELLAHGRFKGTVYIDDYRNAVFPHYKGKEICGYSKKNWKFDGFSEGGDKLLWRSNFFPDDKKLVVAEAGIDALSIAYMTWHNPKFSETFYHTRFISIDGGMSPEAEKMLRDEVAAMPADAVIEAAFDNDAQGTQYTEKLRAICEDCRRTFQENRPKRKKDWNDVLQSYVKRESEINAVYGASAESAPTRKEASDSCSQKQVALIQSLVQQGVLNPVPDRVLDTMPREQARKLIYIGIQRQKEGVLAPPPKGEAEKKTSESSQGMSM